LSRSSIAVTPSESVHVLRRYFAGPDKPYLFVRQRVSGRDPAHRSNRSSASFHDPDGNGWLFQEITTRLPGRIDPATTTFASAADANWPDPSKACAASRIQCCVKRFYNNLQVSAEATAL